MDFRSPIATVIPGARGEVLGILAATTAPLTGRGIAELASGAVSQSGVSKALAPLVASGLVTCERAGAANLYRLNRDHVAADAVLSAAGAHLELLDRIATTVNSWTPRPVAVWMFGSAARGRATPSSDVDILIVRPDGIDDTDHSWDTNVLRLVDAVHRWSGNTCECLEYSSSEFASLVKTGDPLIASLRRDGIVIAGGSPHELTTAEG